MYAGVSAFVLDTSRDTISTAVFPTLVDLLAGVGIPYITCVPGGGGNAPHDPCCDIADDIRGVTKIFGSSISQLVYRSTRVDERSLIA